MKMTSNKTGWTLVFLFSLISVLIWTFMQSLSTRFVNISVTMTSLGQLTALVGTILLCITFILSTRLRAIERAFGGLDKVYVAHHIIGTVSFLLLLFHPLFLAIKFAMISASTALHFLIPSSDIALNAGIFSLTAMILFLLFTFFIKLNYQKWKITHKLLGTALLFALVHILFITSDISRNIILRYYIMAFVFIGIASFLYRSIFHIWLVKKYEYVVKDVKVSGSITNIILDAKEGQKLRHLPGQFVFISFPKIIKEFHPFTISSSPDEEGIRLSVKSLGDYTSNIQEIKKGDVALIEGPYGMFRSNAPSQIWIAGGIGITPFISLAKSLKDSKNNRDTKVDLYYVVGDKANAVFLEELNNIAKQNKNLRVITYFSAEKGRMNADFVSRSSGDLKDKDILLCGPVLMMRNLKEDFKKMGVKNSKIHMEEFALL